MGIALVFSCQGPFGGQDGTTGTLAISFGDATSRSLLPSISMDIAEYIVEGSGPDGATFSVQTSESSVVVKKLPFGDWSISVRGLNDTGIAIGTGNATAVIHTGETTMVGITVRPYEGDGSLGLTVLWNEADIDSASIDATLLPIAGGEIPLAFSIAGAQATFSSAAIPAGYYTLTLKLRDNGIVVMGAVETVRIVKGALTEGSFSFLEVNKPGGTIDINITPEMDDPLTVTIHGLGSDLIGTAPMEVSATIAENLNAVYVWFLNGEQASVGQSFSIAGLPDGFYRLDVTAVSADGMRAGSTTGSFHAIGSIDLSCYMKIHQVQGASHVSPYDGQIVDNLVGVVTAKDSKGFWMQSPVPDADPATSEGILVYFNAAPDVLVGDLVVVKGTVKEYGFNNELRLTELTYPTIVSTIVRGHPLPEATVIGRGGRVPPALVICDDGNVGATSLFDPDQDGIDFWESVESMLVRVNDAVVTGSGAYGELAVVADFGMDVPVDRRTARGGVSIAEGIYNPEVVLVDTDAYILGLPAMEAKTGDGFAAPIIGIMSYSYGNFLILPTSAPTIVPGSLPREGSAIVGSADRLTVATFNLENFPRSVDSMTSAEIAAKVADIAGTIVNGLNSPDIIVVEEMTDDSYSANNGVVSAAANFALLIDAIVAAGGPNTYQFRQIDPLNNQEGGWLGANIRVGFLFNGARVAFADKPGGDAVTDTQVLSDGGELDISLSPGRISVASFVDSRKPLIGKFVFNGQPLYVIGAHLASKGGDDPLWGINQPPILASEIERLVQANAINDFVDQMLAVDPQAAVIVAGDLNDFAFSAPIRALQGDVLHNMVEELMPSGERYTYVYDGNSQQLDHVIASQALFVLAPMIDVVHRNSEYAPSSQATDHDPVLASFLIPSTGDTLPPAWISGYPAALALGETEAQVSFKINEAGTVYYALLADGAAAPSVPELVLGASLALAALEEGVVSFDGLVSDTPYDLYAIAKDAEGNLPVGPMLVEFRTDAPVVEPPTGISGLFFSDYGEGSSNNKYLEVYNASAAPITLTEADGTPRLFMLLASNGNPLVTGMAVYKFPLRHDRPAQFAYRGLQQLGRPPDQGQDGRRSVILEHGYLFQRERRRTPGPGPQRQRRL